MNTLNVTLAAVASGMILLSAGTRASEALGRWRARRRPTS